MWLANFLLHGVSLLKSDWYSKQTVESFPCFAESYKNPTQYPLFCTRTSENSATGSLHGIKGHTLCIWSSENLVAGSPHNPAQYPLFCTKSKKIQLHVKSFSLQ